MSMYLFFLQQSTGVWTQFAPYGPTVIMLALILGFLIRIAPTWKDVKLREFDLRAEENSVKKEQAGALTLLADVLKSVAVEQRRATESVELMQRVNSDGNERLSHTMQSFNARLEVIERRDSSDARHIAEEAIARIEKIEKHVESEGSKT
jgi:hypothetical protein